MSRVAVIGLVLGACSFTPGSAPVDAPPDPDTGIDTPGPPGDRDGDGITDTLDVCPDVADPLQLDHDGDLHGDACDRCPHRASTSDPD